MIARRRGGPGGMGESTNQTTGSRFDRLGPGDLTMLLTDRGQVPMNTGAILVFDAAYEPGPEALRAVLADRVAAIPRLRQRVQRLPMGCGAPIWVDDADFAIDRHLVDREVVDRPADRHLLDLAAELICERMPLEHPPWRAYLVAGSPGGRVRALVLVVHHVMADGLGGLAVLHALADPGLEPLLREFPQRRPPYRSLAVDAARQRARRVRNLGAELRLGLDGVKELSAARAHPRVAGRTSLTRPTSGRRRLSTVDVPLADLVAAAKAAGGTVNDVVLAAVTGALLGLLRSRGEDPTQLVVSVPVSGRAGTDSDLLRRSARTGLPAPRPPRRICLVRRTPAPRRHLRDEPSRPGGASLPRWKRGPRRHPHGCEPGKRRSLFRCPLVRWDARHHGRLGSRQCSGPDSPDPTPREHPDPSVRVFATLRTPHIPDLGPWSDPRWSTRFGDRTSPRVVNAGPCPGRPHCRGRSLHRMGPRLDRDDRRTQPKSRLELACSAGPGPGRNDLAAGYRVGPEMHPEGAGARGNPQPGQAGIEPAYAGRILDDARGPLEQDAPPRSRRGIGLVDLEGHPPSVRGNLQLRAPGGEERDAGTVEEVGHRENRHVAVGRERDPPDLVMRRSRQTFLKVQDAQAAPVGRAVVHAGREAVHDDSSGRVLGVLR